MKRLVISVDCQEGPLPWRVLAESTPYPSLSFSSKGQAMEYARRLAKTVNGALKLKDLSGKFTQDRKVGAAASSIRIRL